MKVTHIIIYGNEQKTFSSALWSQLGPQLCVSHWRHRTHKRSTHRSTGKRINWSMEQKQRGSRGSFGWWELQLNQHMKHNPQFWKWKVHWYNEKKKKFIYQEFKYEARVNFYSVPTDVKRWILSAISGSVWLVGSAIQTKDMKFDMLRALIFMNSI